VKHLDNDNLPPLFVLSPEDEATNRAAVMRVRSAWATMIWGSLPHLAGILGEKHPSVHKAVEMYARCMKEAA
jgi:hypothetical protein